MYDCPNCGLLPFACVCVEWCYDHDVAQQLCKRCQMNYRENAAPVNPNQAAPEERIDFSQFIVPWYELVFRYLIAE